MSKKTFFLESAWNHGGMIDYSLTFTKRGRKPYPSLICNELQIVSYINFESPTYNGIMLLIFVYI